MKKNVVFAAVFMISSVFNWCVTHKAKMIKQASYDFGCPVDKNNGE
ncbi:MAG: hypothetical protein JXR95_04395 [Deltaproteobacteria bacterium]|nr:hypothetical protein [Deltaproteobacteria bacterium]